MILTRSANIGPIIKPLKIKTSMLKGQVATVCQARKQIIKVTPEEEVRQSVISYLNNSIKVPLSMIECEASLTHYGIKSKDRMDLVVTALDDQVDRKPILVVECKQPKYILCQEDLDQAIAYANKVEANFVLLSNLDENYFIDIKEKKYLSKVPGYRQMVSKSCLSYFETCLDSYNEIDHKKLTRMIKNGDFEQAKDDMERDNDVICFGDDSPMEIAPLTFALSNLLFRKSKSVKQIGKYEVKDYGTRWTKYGNAGGGKYDGRYRAFYIDNPLNTIVSFSTFATMSTINDSHWGNRKGMSYLNVSIDNVDNSHNSLQLCIDKYCHRSDTTWIFEHDGTLTTGSKGRVKNHVTLDAVRKDAPHLVQEGRIRLGTIEADKDYMWSSKDVSNLFSNLIEYCIIREKVRESIAK